MKTFRDHADHEAATLFTYLLLGDLRELLDEPATVETRHALRVFLDVLLDELPDRSRLKRNGEFLGEVLDEFPNWSGQVESLRCGEAADYSRLAELRETLRGNVSYAALADEIACDLREWMDSVSVHRGQERRLVQMAANREVGGEA